MKKIFYTILAATVIFSGCRRETIMQPRAEGTLTLDLSCKADLTELITKADPTEEEIINGLLIDIVRTSDGYARPSTPYGELRGKAIELGAGPYSITASSPEKTDAAYDQPIFEGTNTFEIKLGQATKTSIDCSIKNVKVTILLSEGFHQELSGYTISVSNGAGTLFWTKTSQDNDFLPDEDSGNTVYKGKKAGYFMPAPLTVTVNGFRGDGAEATLTRKINDVKAADHHIIKLDADVTGSLGGIDITISDKVNNVEDEIIVGGFEEIPVEGGVPGGDNDGDNGDDNSGDNGDGGEDNGGNNGEEGGDTPAEPSTAPTLVWEANPTFADTDLPMTMDAQVDVELMVNAPKGIRDFFIYVESGVLSETIAAMTEAGEDGMVDGVTTMDMINDDTLYEYLSEKLPMQDQLLDKTSVLFSLSELVPMINMYVQLDMISPGDRHTFTLHVVDNEGQVLRQAVTFVSVAVN